MTKEGQAGQKVDMATVYQDEHIDAQPLAGSLYTPKTKTKKWTYQIVKEGGRTNKVKGVMEIPMDQDPQSIATRSHEVAHAGWSPILKPAWKAHGQAFEAIEEARINVLMNERNDHPLHVKGFEKMQKQFFKKLIHGEYNPPLTDRARALAALMASDEKAVDLFKIESDKGREFLHRVYQEHINNRSSNIDAKNNVKYSEEMDTLWVVPPECPSCGQAEHGKGNGSAERCPGSPQDGKGNGEAIGHGIGHDTKESDRKPEGLPDGSWSWQDETTGGKPRPDLIFNPGDTVWGEMELQRPPLVRPSKAMQAIGIRPRRIDEGFVLRDAHRLVTDGMVFRLKKRKPKVQGGTILLDASGSMSLTYDQIESLLQAAPAAEIAMYCGDNRRGFLRVLAKDGKMCTKDHYERPSNNLVDGPALKWLGTRPGPRYWISDEGVTGLGERQPGTLVSECRRTCTEFKITRIQTIETALEQLNKQAVVDKPKGWT